MTALMDLPTRTPKHVRETPEIAAWAVRTVRALGKRSHGDRDALPMLAALQQVLDAEMGEAVRSVIAAGYSWADVGAQLGVTRQAAYERWSKPRELPQPRIVKGALELPR